MALPSSRPRRQLIQVNYRDLHYGRQAYGFAAFEPDIIQEAPRAFALTAFAAMELLDSTPSVPSNWHEAKRCDDYDSLWLLAMKV